MSFTSTPKTLAEHPKWMADNLFGFRKELDAVREIERRQYAKSCTAAPARSVARTGAAVQRAETPPQSRWVHAAPLSNYGEKQK